ncbi:transcriptional regulatory protein ZraR [bacterium BMS3Abin07]|nr:transcriptional regulatory protein ZraR [bacterium BMS3Abin07]GBE33412.1 transcriptional regulatory protein ZraR [bacterium BMS3Bbin05]HDL19722.1 sigma-54-dependent Fis family transcriptional regulator [Nitrospirota bacterium]HDO21238.1 sigma-54-dependent Fis family transcriptional regulator [Nitrospirota bacterium]HDZ87549.1 sigma-54-dependent Fis family transcriptional regulator [Nitrospirota bacterium]
MPDRDIIFIVEDKESMAEMLKQTLESSGFGTIIAKDGAEAIDTISNERFDLVLTDLKLPKKDGIEVLKRIKEEHPIVPVIVMTAFGTIETAVEAMKLGASDFITKPFDTDHLILLINRALETQKLYRENILLRESFPATIDMPAIIGKSSQVEEVIKKIQKVAPGKTTVLILGESGTGKELFARAVHLLSPRKDYPFVPINCAAIPHELIESELFGHEKGAFTGADSRKMGKFELADRGTIFLDEVSELDISLQAKLLRVLQEGEIERVGSVKQLKVDIRIIAASNRKIDEAVGENRFREDLYYRLSVFPVVIPPLRDRKEDIPSLVEFFLDKYCAELNRKKKTVSKKAMDIIIAYSWKGNVRELENAIERAIILCDGREILPEHIILSPPKHSGTDMSGLPMDGSLEDAAKEALRIAETMRIRKALESVRWNKTKASEMLGVSYKTLLTKIKEYRLELDT